MKKKMVLFALGLFFSTSIYFVFKYSSIEIKSYVITENYNSGPTYGILKRDVTITENANLEGLSISFGIIGAASLAMFVWLLFQKDNRFNNRNYME